ncbi:DUF5655 domain-containing protein [Enterococcus gilvus]|uniref:DUF5655 domain-containing protein n=1 Tax=Enterococcus gilvus TaxID=160453 RepID=UPI001C8C14AA|nr:DUF5655 domain-containing protein [Enterococcus gilvus]MBX8935416.1 hypothetical protein [Enterococcus gilvus]
MPLYKLSKDKSIIEIEENDFRKESELQRVVENNLEELFGLEFIDTEHVVGKFRMDTVAYNPIQNSFVIIEYKNRKSSSVIDQGYTYLNLITEHKPSFVLAYNEQKNTRKRKDDFDWSQSRVLFISTNFNDYQIGAAKNPILPIDLVKVKLYHNNIFEVEEITKSSYQVYGEEKNPALNSVKKLNKEIKVYTEQELIQRSSEEIRELYYSIKENITSWDDSIKVGASKLYVYFKRKTNFCDISIGKNQLKLWLNYNYGELNDSKKLFRNVKEVGHHGNGDYEIIIKDDKDLEYILSVIKEAWSKKK